MTGWEITKKSYSEIYSNLSAIFIASFLWFLTAGIVLLANFISINAILVGKPIWVLPFLIIALLTVGPATAGAFYITNLIVNCAQASISDFFKGAKKYFFKSIGLTSIFSLVGAILFFDFNFFATSDLIWMQISSAIWLYALIIVSIVLIYTFSLMIELDKLGANNSIKNIIKHAVFLVIKEIKFTLFIYLQVLIYMVLSMGLVITVPTLFLGGLSLIANNSTLNLLVKYDLIDKVNGPYDFQ